MCLCYNQLEGMLGVKELYTWLDICGGCPFLFRGKFSGFGVCPKCYEVRQCLLAVGWLLSGYCLAAVWLRIIRFRLSGRLGGVLYCTIVYYVLYICAHCMSSGCCLGVA